MLGLGALRLPGLARGERGWLLTYAPPSFIYRALLLLSLAVVLADVSASLGLIVLALALVELRTQADDRHGDLSMVVAGAEPAAWRAASVGLGTLTIAGLLAFVVPLPHRTHAPAVVWLPNEAIVRPASDGFVEQVLVADGQEVRAGTPLLTLGNDPLRVELERVLADLQRRDVERAALFADAALRRSVLDDEIARLSAERARLQQRVDQLVVHAAVDGRVAIDPRLHVRAATCRRDRWWRTCCPQVRRRWCACWCGTTTSRPVAAGRGPIRVALAHGDSGELPAQLERATPRAAVTLPSAALAKPAAAPSRCGPATTADA